MSDTATFDKCAGLPMMSDATMRDECRVHIDKDQKVTLRQSTSGVPGDDILDLEKYPPLYPVLTDSFPGDDPGHVRPGKPFPEGTVVYLKTGSPKLIVEDTRRDNMVPVVWFDGNKVKRDAFAPVLLTTEAPTEFELLYPSNSPWSLSE